MKTINPLSRPLILILVLFIFKSGIFANIDLLESRLIHYQITHGEQTVINTDINQWPIFENFDWDNLSANDQLNLAFVVDANKIDAPSLWIDASFERFKIIQDSTLLYASGIYPVINPIVLKLHSTNKSRIIISVSFSSKELNNKIFSIKFGEYRLLLKEAEESIMDLILGQLHIIIISSIILFFGILSLAFFIVRWRDQNFAFLYYGIAVSMSAFVNIDIRFIHQLLELPNWLYNFMQLNGRFGIFFLFILFVRQIFALETKNIINKALYAACVYWIIAVFAFYFINNSNVFSLLSIAYGPFALIVLIIVILEVSKSKVYKELPDKQIFLFFISLFLIIIVFSVGSLILSMESHRQVPVYLGVFAMSMAMLSLLIGRYVQSERDNFNYQIELEKQRNELLKLQQANMLAQYETLKSQLNPHFLFNSLSTLSSLVYPTANPEKAKTFIDEFSRIFRYLLDVQSKDLVTLASELEFLKSYIFLQQLRYSSGLNIKIKVEEGQLLKVMPPMAIQILVENAIKHNQVSKETPLNIDIYTKEDMLVVKNNLQKKFVNENESMKLGLKNLQDRYIFYKVELEIIELKDTYFVKIPLLDDEHS
jgi:sensor histidine kinase YesM